MGREDWRWTSEGKNQTGRLGGARDGIRSRRGPGGGEKSAVPIRRTSGARGGSLSRIVGAATWDAPELRWGDKSVRAARATGAGTARPPAHGTVVSCFPGAGVA